MASKTDCSIKDTSILKTLILDNPDLPVLLFVGEEAYSGEYAYEQANASKGEIETLTLYDDMWLNEEDYRDKLSDDLCDEEEYKDLSDEEYEKMLDQKIAETEFVKAIVIWVGQNHAFIGERMRKLMIINIFKRGHKQLNSGIDTWIVEWTRRYGQFSGDTEQCYQAFLSKEEADEFADSIRRAHKLIGNTNGTHVSVRKQCGTGLQNKSLMGGDK